ncbi:flavin reductase family protein [Salinicola rhizosphaerae]|uniref:FMN reductase (NADH) RutF n=1 Tax=Salinicola rhizosphaerae TaxID=1443141 RepID=A0ABQ3EGW0_9GAMM|nr:flavin reductase family protein [Salinicola rhizosphaerae]GHB34409.1 FMN reductase (NADH) RutF [Salinicola rhizosphaerae]
MSFTQPATAAQPSLAPNCDSQTFLDAMRYVGTGVTVVTTGDADWRKGSTVSAMCSLSAEPASILICVNRDSNTGAAIKARGTFCVNVLNAEQSDIARVFAGMRDTADGDRFSESRWDELATGAPALENAAASFDCHVGRMIDYGTHTIFVGDVVAARTSRAEPLYYYNRDFHTGSPLDA